MKFREIADVALTGSRADETEVLAMEQDESLTRFANNAIHQNVTERNIQITVRAVLGTKVGTAVSNDLRPESLRDLAARAYAVARLQPDNPEFKGLPAPQDVTPVNYFDGAVSQCTPEERASRVAVICRKSIDAQCTAAGSFTTSSFLIGIANSKGLFVEHRSTMADASTVIMRGNASGWAQRTGWRLNS